MGDYQCDNIPTQYMISVEPALQEGEVFFAVADDEVWFCEHLYGEKCVQFQGSNACTDEVKCRTLLHELGPAELAAMKRWVSSGDNPNILFGGQQGALSKYTGPYDSVKRASEIPNLAHYLKQYYTPVSETQIKEQCKNGAMIALDASVMESACGEGTYGCQINPNPQNPFCATTGQAPCMYNHWVLIRDCDDADGIVNVWSWGAIFKMSYANLAGITTAIVEIPSADNNNSAASSTQIGSMLATILFVVSTIFLQNAF